MNSPLLNVSDSNQRMGWAHRTTLITLVLLGCLIMVNTSSVMDTARDIYNAWQIASGHGFPLEGPQLASVIHSGPVWFYILALPLLFSPSWVLMSLWVGFLTSMKYVLAYACGSRLGSRDFGLVWACLLALPGWSAINYLIFAHTNLVGTALLMCLYSYIRWQQANEKNWFFLMCFAVGIGIHAHPTVYAAGIAALPAIVGSVRKRQLEWWHLVIGFVLAIAPMVPYFISQHLNQWPDLQTTQGYIQSQPLLVNLLGFFDVLWGALIDGPIVALRYVLGLQGIALWSAFIFLAATLIIGLFLVAMTTRRNSMSQPVKILLTWSVIIVGCVALIRDVTPFYMTLVIYPPVYGLAAWGWSQGMGKMARYSAWFFPLAAIVSLSGFAFATLEMGKTGQLSVPHKALVNVRSHATDKFEDGIYYPGWGRLKLGKFICDAQRPVYFHGYASLLLEQSYALEARMLCETDRVYIGGKGTGQHLVGVSHWDAEQLAIATELSMGSMAIYDVAQVLAPEHAEAIPVGDTYPPRPYLRSKKQQKTIEFVMGKDEILAITNLYHFWMRYSVEVQLDGVMVDPFYKSTVTAFYKCSDCPAAKIQNWSVTISAPSPEFVELVTFFPETRREQAVQ